MGNPFDGSKWKSLGLVRVESDTLRVELSNAGVDAAEVVIADGVRIVPVIPPDQAIGNLTTVYESSLVLFALLDRGTAQDLTSARLIADSFLYALANDSTGGGAQLPTAPDGSRALRDAYSSGDLPLRNSQSPPKDAMANQVRLAGFSTDTRITGASGFALVLDGAFGGTGSARSRLFLRHSIGLEDRRLVGRILVRCQQIHEPAVGSFLEVLHQLVHLFLGAFAGDHTQHQTVLGIESDMIPIVPLLGIRQYGGVTVLLFLADEGPLLIELRFPSLRGKKPRVRRGVVGRGRQRLPPAGPRCSY